MIGFGVPSSVNSLFGMSWQPGVQTPTANEYAVGSYYTVNNEGSALRRAPPTMVTSGEQNTRSDLSSAWAGFYRELEKSNSFYDQLYKQRQQVDPAMQQYISIAGMPFRQATSQPADLLQQTLCMAYSPPQASSETSETSIFPADILPFVGSTPPPPHEYEHFLESLLTDTASDVPVPGLQQTSPQRTQLEVPDMNAAAAPQGSNNQWQVLDALDLDHVLMQADAEAASENSASSPQLQLPSAMGGLAAAVTPSHGSGNTAAVLRHQAPPSNFTQRLTSRSLAGRGLRGSKRKNRNVSSAAHSAAPSVSPAHSQTGDDNPAKKRRIQDESSTDWAAAPVTTPASPQTAQAGPGKKQRTAAPAKKRAAKHSAETHSSLPQLSPAEIAQAKEDGLVFARVGNYAAWPAQRPTAEQLDLLNDHADSSSADRVFVVFYGKHDFNMVSQSRVNMSFEDGLRKCKLKRGSALEVAVNEAINHIRAKIAMHHQAAAQIYC
ncbi:TPA: hypothetical protein ACH3X1_006188 [Trebouxia sp. C0004]